MHQSPVSRPDSRANNNNARYQTQHQSPHRQSYTDRPGSSDSDASSVSSRVTTLNRPKGPLRSLNAPSSPHPPRTSSIGVVNANNSNVSLPSTARQTGTNAPLRPPNDPVSRKPSPRAPLQELQRHRPRQHSQGFFEPSLPTASLSDHTMTALSASQIAAQAAMQSTQQQHVRHRSQTVPIEEGLKSRKGSRDSPPPAHLVAHTTTSTSNIGAGAGGAGFYSNTYQNGLMGSRSAAATTAANIAFPRQQAGSEVADPKQKADKTKRTKFFPKPKHIGISSSRDWIGSSKDKAQSSPNKLGFGSSSGLSRMVSASTANLTEVSSNNSSMYSLSNASASTVVPLEKGEKEKEKDKEKNHKHHFLSRQKLKLKEDLHHLHLSSANSNSRPLDPNAPQSLYSFAPSSPGPSSTSFPKSGLDLLHGGRALREKRREEKAMVIDASRDSADSDWPLGSSSNVSGTATPYGNPSLGNLGGVISNDSVKETLQGFGLHNMTAEDVWDFLKAKLLVIFDGGDVRIAVEDLNKLVVIHIQLCVQKQMPTIVEDLRELLHTGFSTLNHSISGIPDEKLVPHLMQIWLLAFGTILPFIQAVFLPLDLEFKGRGSVMNAREAREFWGALPTHGDSEESSLGDELDVRMIVLTAFRDTVILQRYEGLNAVFSRLSLDTINATIGALSSTSNSSSSGGRPGTAASLDPTYSSFNSQQSSLLNIAGSYSSDSATANRSRATSNTSSNPDQLIFQSFTSPSQRQLQTLRNNQNADSSHLITDTVGRMLQCFSVLASIQSGDQAQERVEALTKTLKHNWLGRGRTGRDRRGFVGTKVKPAMLPRQNSDDSSSDRVTMTNGSSNGNAAWRNSLLAGVHRNMGMSTAG